MSAQDDNYLDRPPPTPAASPPRFELSEDYIIGPATPYIPDSAREHDPEPEVRNRPIQHQNQASNHPALLPTHMAPSQMGPPMPPLRMSTANPIQTQNPIPRPMAPMANSYRYRFGYQNPMPPHVSHPGPYPRMSHFQRGPPPEAQRPFMPALRQMLHPESVPVNIRTRIENFLPMLEREKETFQQECGPRCFSNDQFRGLFFKLMNEYTQLINQIKTVLVQSHSQRNVSAFTIDLQIDVTKRHDSINEEKEKLKHQIVLHEEIARQMHNQQLAQAAAPVRIHENMLRQATSPMGMIPSPNAMLPSPNPSIPSPNPMVPSPNALIPSPHSMTPSPNSQILSSPNAYAMGPSPNNSCISPQSHLPRSLAIPQNISTSQGATLMMPASQNISTSQGATLMMPASTATSVSSNSNQVPVASTSSSNISVDSGKKSAAARAYQEFRLSRAKKASQKTQIQQQDSSDDRQNSREAQNPSNSISLSDAMNICDANPRPSTSSQQNSMPVIEPDEAPVLHLEDSDDEIECIGVSKAPSKPSQDSSQVKQEPVNRSDEVEIVSSDIVTALPPAPKIKEEPEETSTVTRPEQIEKSYKYHSHGFLRLRWPNIDGYCKVYAIVTFIGSNWTVILIKNPEKQNLLALQPDVFSVMGHINVVATNERAQIRLPALHVSQLCF